MSIQGANELHLNLDQGHFYIHMDFAEDYDCRDQQEVQLAYWNTSQVTLHPAVVYCKDGEEVKHKSYAFNFPELRHDANFVCAVLKELATCLKDIRHQVNYVHYWTDSLRLCY